MSPCLLILFAILLGLAAPVGIAKESWRHLLGAMVMSLFVVLLPLFVFFFSSFMAIDLQWKGACEHGWMDCFIVGKLALSPFILVAAAALYKTDVLRVKVEAEQWVVIGVFLGAVIATVCLVFSLVCLPWKAWLLVPLYVAVWYSFRAAQLIRATRFRFRTYFTAMLSTIPFWLLSWWWSRQLFESLPNEAPKGCFVVTAASHGHLNIVGPFALIEHGGRIVQANQQLITFWQFENLWREQFPLSHHAFRRFYDRFGPHIAGQIRSPWVADVIFLALKPLELTARFINHNFRRSS